MIAGTRDDVVKGEDGNQRLRVCGDRFLAFGRRKHVVLAAAEVVVFLLPGERVGQVQSARVPLSGLHLQRVVPRHAERHARRADAAELRERTQALRYCVRRRVRRIRKLIEAASRRRGRIQTRHEQRLIGRVMQIEAEQFQTVFAERIQAVEVVREEPGAAVAHVRAFDDQIFDHFALQPDAPLRHLRHLAGVGMNPHGRVVDLAQRRPDARIVRHEEQRVAVVNQAIA